MRYHNITKDDMLNGAGIRAVLWLSGCSHACKECHNPITWDPNGGIPFDFIAKEELFDELSKDYVDGVTFSGGDPLHKANIEGITALAKEIRDRFPDKTIWLYTGYVWNDIKNMNIIKYLDVVVDGKFEVDKKDDSLHWRGSANQLVIDVKNTLEVGMVVLYD